MNPIYAARIKSQLERTMKRIKRNKQLELDKQTNKLLKTMHEKSRSTTKTPQ